MCRQSLADDPDGCAKWPENGPGSGRARGGCSSSGSLRAAAAAAGRHILGPRVYPDTAPESVSCDVSYVRYNHKYGRAGVWGYALLLCLWPLCRGTNMGYERGYAFGLAVQNLHTHTRRHMSYS